MSDTYTIKAIGQDDFSDIPIPDAPIQSGATVGSTPNVVVPNPKK
jgi:cytochrome c oxidase assembly factor 3